MEICIWKDADELGRRAAAFTADVIRRAILEKGSARLLVSTGASQLETFKYLVAAEIPWDKIEMFHLDEYVDLPEAHPASFRKYLKERFVSQVPLAKAHFVSGEGDTGKEIAELTQEIAKAPIDMALIGIGENAHIAFNDPPADFSTDAAYIVVNLDNRCKQQQVGEGWFPSVDSVPKQAISMTVRQILKCRVILSCVPHKAKAEAIRQTMATDPTPMVPATILKTHPNWTLYLDEASAGLLPPQQRMNANEQGV